MIYAQMATIPSRVRSAREVAKRILPQVSRLCVWLNGFHQDYIPDWACEKTVFNRGEDLGDRGKIAWDNKGIIFLIDDDILYPPDYVVKMMQYMDKPIVGVHGSTIKPNFKSYYKGRKVYHFSTELKKGLDVDLLGTGTVCYSTDSFSMSLSDAPKNNVLDCYFGIKAKSLGIPLYCVPRKKHWLSQIPVENSLYKSNSTLPTELIKQVNW